MGHIGRLRLQTDAAISLSVESAVLVSVKFFHDLMFVRQETGCAYSSNQRSQSEAIPGRHHSGTVPSTKLKHFLWRY